MQEFTPGGEGGQQRRDTLVVQPKQNAETNTVHPRPCESNETDNYVGGKDVRSPCTIEVHMPPLKLAACVLPLPCTEHAIRPVNRHGLRGGLLNRRAPSPKTIFEAAVGTVWYWA